MSITLTFEQCLAQGAFGRVYTAEETPDKVYKVFFDKFEMPPPIELDCMFRLDHENIMKADCLYTLTKVPSKLKKGSEKVTLYKNGKGKFLVIQMERAVDDLFGWKKIKPSYEQKVKVIWDVLKAVDFFHNCHLLHLDIKTENVLIMKDGTAKLSDFGLVIPITTHGRMRDFKREMITENYRPPENLDKSRSNQNRYVYRQTSDVWSLGILISEIFMLYENGNFIENNQLKMVEKILGPQNIKNTFFSKIGRGLNAEKKELWFPLVSWMLQIDPSKRPTVKEVMNHKIFKSFGFEYKPEGMLIQPVFPSSPYSSYSSIPFDEEGKEEKEENKEALTEEDYILKLEYFLHKIMKILSHYSVVQNYRYPIQVLFVACDIFLRFRHFYDSSDDISALSLNIATYLCCERDIDLDELEEFLELNDLKKKFREMLFLTDKLVFFNENAFSVAYCECRMKKLLNILFTDFKTYVEMTMNSDYSPITEKCCKLEPQWGFNAWSDYIQGLCPKLEIYTVSDNKKKR